MWSNILNFFFKAWVRIPNPGPEDPESGSETLIWSSPSAHNRGYLGGRAVGQVLLLGVVPALFLLQVLVDSEALLFGKLSPANHSIMTYNKINKLPTHKSFSLMCIFQTFGPRRPTWGCSSWDRCCSRVDFSVPPPPLLCITTLQHFWRE